MSKNSRHIKNEIRNIYYEIIYDISTNQIKIYVNNIIKDR